MAAECGPEPGGTGLSRLVLLRHGQSEFNAADVFTGWADPPLTGRGERQAAQAGRDLADAGLRPDVVHTSLLRRAVDTAHLALTAAERSWVPVRRSWRLNGRHYGALQGMGKDAARREYGAQAVERWRRSYSTCPPDARMLEQAEDPRYAGLPPELLPRAESLEQVSARLLPYWYDAIVPDLRPGAVVLVVSHGNTLRALVKHLDRIGDESIVRVEIPSAVPLVYLLDDQMAVVGKRPLTGMALRP